MLSMLSVCFLGDTEMLPEYVLLLAPSILAYILFFTLYLVDSRYDLPQWFMRKTIHSIGNVMIGVFIGLLIDPWKVIQALIIFLVLLALFSLPPVRLLQFLLVKSTRKGETRLETFITVALTSISLLVLYFVFQGEKLVWFLSGIFVLAIADGFGEFVGRPFGKHKYVAIASLLSSEPRFKSIEGSIGVFLGSVLGITLAFLLTQTLLLNLSIILLIFLIAVIVTILEGLSTSFIDNIVLPWSVALLGYWLM